MDCKKFSIGGTPKKEPLPAPAPPKISTSVSKIEIKPQSIPQSNAAVKKRKGNRFIPLFCGICFVAVLLCAFCPIPDRLEIFLSDLAQIISEPVYRNTQLLEETTADKSASKKETLTEKVFAPPASNSSITETEGAKEGFALGSMGTNMTSVSNETSYNIDIESVLSQKYPIERISPSANDEAVSVFAQSDRPSVLIIHTHGTEGYSDCAQSNYRTVDKANNVVQVGKRLKEKLEENGVSVLHCETMFDESSYIKAYSNSFSAVNEYLKSFPSIKYVIDLHRDAVPDKDGKGYARLVSQIDGTDCAQLMLVVGTNEAGAVHPEWEKNLRTAFEIQKNMCESYPTLMRSINVRCASFNQQLCRGYFILEAGNCENSLSEALDSIGLFAEVFAKTVSE